MRLHWWDHLKNTKESSMWLPGTISSFQMCRQSLTKEAVWLYFIYIYKIQAVNLMKSILIQISEKILWNQFQSIQLYQVSATEHRNTDWFFGIQYTFIAQKGSTWIMWQAALENHCRSFTGIEKVKEITFQLLSNSFNTTTVLLKYLKCA